MTRRVKQRQQPKAAQKIREDDDEDEDEVGEVAAGKHTHHSPWL
jgi:hypothetical protein